MQFKLAACVAILAGVAPVFGAPTPPQGVNSAQAQYQMREIIQKTQALITEVDALTESTMPSNGPTTVMNFADLAEVTRDMAGQESDMADSTDGEDNISMKDYEEFVETTKQLLLSLETKCPMFRSIGINQQPAEVLSSDKESVESFVEAYAKYYDGLDVEKMRSELNDQTWESPGPQIRATGNQLSAVFAKTEDCFSKKA